MFRTEQIGDCKLYLGDCREVMASWPECFRVDAVVTDPPYGIKQGNGFDGFDGFGGFGPAIQRRQYDNGEWDNERPAKNVFDLIAKKCGSQIIWGGNYFTDILPVSQKWLFWDKCQTMPTYSDGEIAWTNLPGVSTKRIIYNNNGLMAKEKDRVHPTQKPIEVMKWCLGFVPDAKTILDPFMGSGTTGVACVKLDRKFIGIELEPKYFDIACRRIDAAYKEPRLPIPEPKPVQQSMDLM